MQRRHLMQSGLATAGAALMGPSWAQAAYPNKPIKMIIPLAAGSAVDNAARIVSQKMAANLGVGIAIENQTGAAGLIGAERVAKSPADGHTLGGFNDSIMTMLPSFHSKMPWDILKDFEPVSLVATIEWALVVSADSPIKTAAELIDAARKAPGKINYGSGGNGSPQHIAMALFAMQAGVQMTHVPYKGATQAAVGTAAGEVQTCLQGIATVSSLVKADFRNVIIVMTTNAGAETMNKATIGFTNPREAGDEMIDIKRLFTPEFRNRLDAIVSFKALDEVVILRVVDKFLLQLETQLAEKKVEVAFTDALRKYLAKKGFDPLMGARPMQRLIQDTIRRALADELLFGRLVDGGRLTVDIKLSTDDKGVESGEVTLDITPLSKKEGKAKPESEEATAG